MRKGFLLCLLLLFCVFSCKKDSTPQKVVGNNNPPPAGSDSTAVKALVNKVTGVYYTSVVYGGYYTMVMGYTDTIISLNDTELSLSNQSYYFTGNLSSKIYTFSNSGGSTITIDTALQILAYCQDSGQPYSYTGTRTMDQDLVNIITNVAGVYIANDTCSSSTLSGGTTVTSSASNVSLTVKNVNNLCLSLNGIQFRYEPNNDINNYYFAGFPASEEGTYIITVDKTFHSINYQVGDAVGHGGGSNCTYTGTK